MAKIIFKTPSAHENPYRPTFNTDGVDVEIRDAFIGVSFVTEEGEKLSVSMRDGGFEVLYSGDYGETGFDVGMIEFKNGTVGNQSDYMDDLRQSRIDLDILREVFSSQIRNALFDGKILIGSLGNVPSKTIVDKDHIEVIRRVFGIPEED